MMWSGFRELYFITILISLSLIPKLSWLFSIVTLLTVDMLIAFIIVTFSFSFFISVEFKVKLILFLKCLFDFPKLKLI